MRLSILIPVYNEAQSIAAVLQRAVRAVSLFEGEQVAAEVIVVDDASIDGSYEAVRAFAGEHAQILLRLIRHPVHAGRGAAVRTAIEHAESEFCLLHGADLQCEPIDYRKLLAPLFSGEADVLLSARAAGTASRNAFGFWQAAVNRFVGAINSMATGLERSGGKSSCVAFRTSLAQSVPLRSNRFGIDLEMMIQFAKRHARFIEAPVDCSRRDHGSIGIPQMLLAIGNILRTLLFSAAHRDPAADILIRMSRAKRFNCWMAESIAPWLAGEVLELGAGIGNLTVLLASDAHHYTATDTDREHLLELCSRIDKRRGIAVRWCDFLNSEDIDRFRRSADTVVCLNALEHVDDDMAALANIHTCLRPGGRAILLVPQGPGVFGGIDEVLHHKRRYSSRELQQKMSAAGFQLEHIGGFNRATWPGWYVNSRLLGKRTISRLQLRLFDCLVPLLKRIDHKLPWPPASLIAVGIVVD